MHVHVTQLRAVPLVLAAMKHHRAAAEVQSNACRLLANLALTGSSCWCCGICANMRAGQVRDYLVKENVPMHVIFAVKDLATSIDVQHYGYWCLANLAVDGGCVPAQVDA